MSARIARALRMLAQGGVLAPLRDGGGFGVVAEADRRRRARCALTRADVAALLADGAVEGPDADGTFRLTPAGAARARRDAPVQDPFAAQHAPRTKRTLLDDAGDEVVVTGVDPAGPVSRLAGLTDAAGRPFFTAAEIAAAKRLRLDWEDGRRGELSGSAWGLAAGAGGNGPRALNRAEQARLRGLEARERARKALEALAAPLRSLAQAVCIEGRGVAALEREAAWPARSGKIALKLALAQLAQAYRAL